jgi:hypothetical protein
VNARRAAAVLFAVALLAPSLATAQDAPPPDAAAEARLQFNQGTQAYKEKRFVEAALHFEAAAAQRPHAVTLYTAALAWEQANKPERAADDFVRALDVPGLSPQQATSARDRVATLEKTLGTALVVGPEGFRVQLEGQTEVAVPARLHGAPGVHKLIVRAPGRPVERRDVTLDVGEFTRVELEESAPSEKPTVRVEPPKKCEPAPAPPPAPPAPAAFPLKKALGLGALGLGVATLGAGAVLGTQALDAKDAYDAAPTRATFDHAQGLQTWTTIAFVAGGVLTAAGVVLLVLPDKRAPASASTALTLTPLPGGLRVGGAF